MTRVRANAIVCESIRYETSGQQTLIGVFPQVMTVTAGQAIKRSVYFDIMVIDNSVADIEIKCLSNRRAETSINVLERISKDKIAGKIFGAFDGPYAIPAKSVLFQVMLIVDGEETELTSVLFEVEPTAGDSQAGVEPVP